MWFAFCSGSAIALDHVSAGDCCEPLERLLIPALRGALRTTLDEGNQIDHQGLGIGILSLRDRPLLAAVRTYRNFGGPVWYLEKQDLRSFSEACPRDFVYRFRVFQRSHERRLEPSLTFDGETTEPSGSLIACKVRGTSSINQRTHEKFRGDPGRGKLSGRRDGYHVHCRPLLPRPLPASLFP